MQYSYSFEQFPSSLKLWWIFPYLRIFFQERSLSLLKGNRQDVRNKIKELSLAMYKSIGGAPSVNPYSANYTSKDRTSSSKGGDDDVTPPALPIGSAGKKASNSNSNSGSNSRRSAAAANNSKSSSSSKKKKRKDDTTDDDDSDEDFEVDEDEDEDEEFDDFSASSSSSAESRTPSPEPVKIKRPPPMTTRSLRTSTRAMSKASALAAAAVSTKEKEHRGKKDKTPQKNGGSSSNTRGGSGKEKKPTAAEAIANSAANAGAKGKGGHGGARKGVTTMPGVINLTTTVTNSSASGGGAATTASSAAASSLPSSNASSSSESVTEESQAIFYPQYHRNNSLVSQAYRAGFFASHGQSSGMSGGRGSGSGGSGSHHQHSSSSSASSASLSRYDDRRSSSLMYPTFPDVKLRRLPFYRVMATLMQPCSLQPSGTARFQEQKFSFFLSPTQVESIERNSYRDTATGRFEYKSQVQLRFSLLETSCQQDDNFPSSICVKVNNKMQSLPNPIPTNKPGVEPKRPPKPINITALCRLSATMANYLDISWAVDFGRGYTVSVYFVERLQSTDLMRQLKDRGTRHPDYTKALIKEKLNDKDADVATMSCKVTLACPLGKMRMTWPCRSSTCDHLQCFDASLYLMMNERKPKWLCPVCNKQAFFDNLLLDGFFKEVLGSARLPSDDHEIVLHNDGSWDPLPTKKEGTSSSPSPPASPKPTIKKEVTKVETFSVDDDSSDTGSNGNNRGASGNNGSSSSAPQPGPSSSSAAAAGNGGKKEGGDGSQQAKRSVVGTLKKIKKRNITKLLLFSYPFRSTA